jgi:hypothetical protein
MNAYGKTWPARMGEIPPGNAKVGLGVAPKIPAGAWCIMAATAYS